MPHAFPASFFSQGTQAPDSSARLYCGFQCLPLPQLTCFLIKHKQRPYPKKPYIFSMYFIVNAFSSSYSYNGSTYGQSESVWYNSYKCGKSPTVISRIINFSVSAITSGSLYFLAHTSFNRSSSISSSSYTTYEAFPRYASPSPMSGISVFHPVLTYLCH